MYRDLDPATRRILRGVAFLLTTIVASTFVYVRAGWSLVDAL